jgi:hypothetical protein
MQTPHSKQVAPQTSRNEASVTRTEFSCYPVKLSFPCPPKNGNSCNKAASQEARMSGQFTYHIPTQISLGHHETGQIAMYEEKWLKKLIQVS